MSRVTILLLSCFMTLTIVTCKEMIPARVNHPDQQCVNKGYEGCCHNIMYEGNGFNCANIECAGVQRANSESRRAMSIGRAADGTHCGPANVCYAGECIPVPRGVNMPFEQFENDIGFDCFRTNQPKPTSRSSSPTSRSSSPTSRSSSPASRNSSPVRRNG